MHWAWTWEPLPPSASVPEEWVIAPRHGPLALPQDDVLLEVDDLEVVVEVDPVGLDPDQQRAATAMVSSVLHAVFITPYHAFFQYQYLTWQFLQSQRG